MWRWCFGSRFGSTDDTSEDALSSWSFFVWLVIFPRIWHAVSLLILFGLFSWTDLMCSLQDGAPSLRTLSTWLSFWWSYMEDLLGMEQHTNFLDDLEDAQGFPRLSIVTPCELADVSLFWFWVRMTVLIDAIWRQFWTSSEHGFHPNQYLKVARAWHLRINASASFLVVKISVIGPVLLPGLVHRSNHPPSTLVGLSVSPQGMLSIPSLFLAGQEFPDLKDFCVIYNFTEWINFFVCFSFALRQLSFLSVESVNSSFPLPSIFRCLHAKCFQQSDALAWKLPSAVWAQR